MDIEKSAETAASRNCVSDGHDLSDKQGNNHIESVQEDVVPLSSKAKAKIEEAKARAGFSSYEDYVTFHMPFNHSLQDLRSTFEPPGENVIYDHEWYTSIISVGGGKILSQSDCNFQVPQGQ